MKICDLTQFYSPVSGGVKRYVAEKVRYLREHVSAGEHVLIIPGARDEVFTSERARIYTLESPLLSRTTGYRILLRLEAVERILERERPDLIECGDPYQVAWRAVAAGAALRIPVVGFYHSHFPEAYLRGAENYLGRTATGWLLELSRHYVRSLYNRFERTVVPSPALGELLASWGVNNVATTDLGVDVNVFAPDVTAAAAVRAEFGIPPGRRLLLYVGRLAHEKNTLTLFDAFRRLQLASPGRFHLLVVGDGLQRGELQALRSELAAAAGTQTVDWLPYCAEPERLARLYQAADLFVHSGVQETFGLVSLEAQACGTPVVGIRGSYMDRIIHSDQALWARENSPAALAAAIAASADQAHAPLALHRRVAAQYSWGEVFGRLFDLYGQVIHNFRRS